MFLVNKPGMSFHPALIDLIYKLIFSGLRSLDFSKVSYFALVFASQTVVLEYYKEFPLLEEMLSFLLYQFLVYYNIHCLQFDFETLFHLETSGYLL